MRARRIVLAQRPVGLPRDDDFAMETVDLPSLADGEVAVESLYLSVDPYMRNRMGPPTGPGPAQALGSPVAGGVIGRVVESRSEAWTVGDVVLGSYGWQTAAVLPEGAVRTADTHGLPLTTALGVLGSTGVTGYFGMRDVGRPGPGDTVVVSAAAGAVGLVASQVARILGARVIGVAGTEAKCAYLTHEARLAAAVDYHRTDFADALAAQCPERVNVYFDNVGGPVSRAVLGQIAMRARLVVCGQIAKYNGEPPEGDETPIPTLLLHHGASMQGFMVMHYADRAAEARAQLAEWIHQGQLRYAETVVNGFDQTVDAFRSLFTGANLGKLLVHVGDQADHSRA
jgi:hypothetical protein